MVENTSGDGDDERRDSTVLTDRDEVRTWADANDFVPVTNTDAETEQSELVRRDEVQSHHEEREWEAFLTDFDERNLALSHAEAEGVVEPRFVDRAAVGEERRRQSESVEEELLEGETVETEVTEREVVEAEVVEETTIESELVDTEVVDTEVVDTEILDEELVGVAVVEAADADVVDRDDRRYIGDDEAIEIESDGTVLLEIDESRVETEERVEKKTIESRVTEQDVDETTTVDDEAASVDIDAVGIHEHIEQTDLVDTQSDDLVEERHVETEFDEDDTATSTITERRTVENTVSERKTLLADVTDVDVEDRELVREEVVETALVESGMSAVPGRELSDDVDQTSGTSTDGERTETTASATEVDAASSDGPVDVSDSQMGQTVATPDGEEIGIVSDVDEEENRLYVDEDPSTTDKIKAHLHWSDEDDASVLEAHQIRDLNRGAVVVETDGLT